MAKILRFTIVTPLDLPSANVWAGFNQELLASLKPPFSRLEFVKYEGQRKGDSISLKVQFFGQLISQTWNTQIIAHRGNCFIDSSSEAPRPLSSWHHVHAVLPGPGKGCRIVDRISFACPYNWLSYLIYIPLYTLFSMRRSGYRRYFGKLV